MHVEEHLDFNCNFENIITDCDEKYENLVLAVYFRIGYCYLDIPLDSQLPVSPEYWRYHLAKERISV